MKDNKKVLFTISIDSGLLESLSRKVEKIGYGASKSGYVSQLIMNDLGVKT
jgi:hypothetical protein